MCAPHTKTSISFDNSRIVNKFVTGTNVICPEAPAIAAGPVTANAVSRNRHIATSVNEQKKTLSH